MADTNGPRGNLPVGGETMSPAMASAANYYAWIASHFQPVLGRRILDIGGGHGAHLANLRFAVAHAVGRERASDGDDS